MDEPYRAVGDIHVLSSSQAAPGYGVLPVNAYLLSLTPAWPAQRSRRRPARRGRSLMRTGTRREVMDALLIGYARVSTDEHDGVSWGRLLLRVPGLRRFRVRRERHRSVSAR
jgi:hypothetical protein